MPISDITSYDMNCHRMTWIAIKGQNVNGLQIHKNTNANIWHNIVCHLPQFATICHTLSYFTTIFHTLPQFAILWHSCIYLAWKGFSILYFFLFYIIGSRITTENVKILGHIGHVQSCQWNKRFVTILMSYWCPVHVTDWPDVLEWPGQGHII